VSALSFFPGQLSDKNDFAIEIAMVVPTTDELIKNISLPTVSDQLSIGNSPDSSSIQSLFSLAIEIELKSNDEIAYYSISIPTADSLSQMNTVTKIELLKERANSYQNGTESIFTDYYVVYGEVETLMKIENISQVTTAYPEHLSLKGKYQLVVEVRDTE
jgi:hypothetical protein